MLKEATRTAQEVGKAEGKGFMQRWADQLDSSVNYGKKYWNMQPDEIIRETHGNFVLDNSSIASVNISRKRERNSAQAYYEMKNETRADNFYFRAYYDPEENLKQSYGARVKRSSW